MAMDSRLITATAIRDSGNVSSITDNGTGNYGVNFTTSMPDANYSATATDDFVGLTPTYSLLAASFRLNSYDDSFSQRDSTTLSVAVFR